MAHTGRPGAPRGHGKSTALAVTILVSVAFPAMAARGAQLTGPAQVVDGNSIAIGGRVVRLYGIDAPDEDQVCQRRGAAWRCGQDAGWALADRQANAYVGQEQAAQRAGRGLWAGKFDPPWAWREKRGHGSGE